MTPIRTALALAAAAASLLALPGCLGRTSDSDARRPEVRIAEGAKVVKEGHDILEFEADANGTVWVEDADQKKAIVSNRIRRGETVRVVPNEDRVVVGGNRLDTGDLKRANAHRIYFQSDAPAGDADNGSIRGDVTKLPGDAEMLQEGRGTELAATARRGGQIYVYDADERRVVAIVKVKSGDRFVLAPADDRITVNGRRAIERDFSTKTNYRVYQER